MIFEGTKKSNFFGLGLTRAGSASPIIGATKARYFDEAADALKIKLTPEDIEYLEEMYVPHPVVGAIRKNPEY